MNVLLISCFRIFSDISLCYGRQLGTRERKEVTIEGRVQFDLLQVWCSKSLSIVLSEGVDQDYLFLFTCVMMNSMTFFYLNFLIQAIQRDYKLSSYSLNSVSAHFLNEQVRLVLSILQIFWGAIPYLSSTLCASVYIHVH